MRDWVQKVKLHSIDIYQNDKTNWEMASVEVDATPQDPANRIMNIRLLH